MAELDDCLTGSRCTACGGLFYPPLRVCPACHGRDLQPQVLSRNGLLYSYSVVRVGPRGVPVPYAVGYVDLAEGVRVFARIENWEAGIDCDMPVAVGLRREADGSEICVARRTAAGGGRVGGIA